MTDHFDGLSQPLFLIHCPMSRKLHPVHPGEVLQEEFLKPMGISQNHLALEYPSARAADQ